VKRLYEYLVELQNVLNSGRLDDLTYAQLLVTITTLHITHNLQTINPTIVYNHVSSLLQFVSKTANHSQFRLQRQMAAESLQELLFFHNVKFNDLVPTVLKCCQMENSHALQSFATLLSSLIFMEVNKTKREVINSLTFLIENIQSFTVWGRAAVFEFIAQIIKEIDYPDNLWKRVFGKFKNSINSYLVHIYCANISKQSKEKLQLNTDDYSQPIYIRNQLIYLQNNSERIKLEYFDELPVKKEKCKIISQRVTSDME